MIIYKKCLRDTLYIGELSVVQWLTYWTAASLQASSNSTRAITFAFGRKPFGKIYPPSLLLCN